MADSPVQRLKDRCQEAIRDMQEYELAQQRKFHLMNEIYGCVMWHERSRSPNQTNEELIFWLSRELEMSEWPIINTVGTVKERLFNLMATNPRCEFWARVQYGITHIASTAELTNGVNEMDLSLRDDDSIDELLRRPPLRETNGRYGEAGASTQELPERL